MGVILNAYISMNHGVTIKPPEELELIRKGGKKLGNILDRLCKMVKPSVTTEELDVAAERMIREAGGEPAFKGYTTRLGLIPFSTTICACLNNEVVHAPAVPSRMIKEGDLVKIDIGMRWPVRPSPGLRPSSPAGRGASKHFPSPSGRGEGEGQRGGREGLLHRVLTVFYWTGLLSAVDGLLGLFFGAHTGFPRATPFGFFGVNPLGPNHNLLAETLIATAPAGLILATRYTLHATRYNWIRYGMWFQWAVALLTFARTAWIAVVVQGMLYLWFEHRGRLRKVWERARLATLPLLLLLPLLLFTLFSETVRGSTLSRLDQARIAVFYFLRSPWIGQGVGTFIPTLWQTKAFLLEYGEPLEAHGIIFKLMFEQGAFGLITFAFFAGLILLVIWRAYRRTPNTAALAALLIASGSLTYQLFNTTYYTSKLWVPMALAFAIAKIYANTDHHTKMVS